MATTAIENDTMRASASATPVTGSGASVPWYLWCAALAVTSAYVGGYWDISWHRSIGRDSFWSAPHMALAGGFFGIEFGTVILLLAFMNRATARVRPALQWLFLYVGGMALSESLLIKLEYIARPDMHNALFFIVVSLGTPAILIAIAIASG